MTNSELERQNRVLWLLVRGYRRKFRAFLEPKPEQARSVDRNDVIELVSIWKASLDRNNIFYEEEGFFEKNVQDAYLMLAKVALAEWKDVIDWFWNIKATHRWWHKVNVVNLGQLAKAHGDWQSAQAKRRMDLGEDFSVYK
jgi:hypothetical protein